MYHNIKKGWQEYISLEDLCEIALEARRLNPNVTFTYNDENWIIPEKRAEMIEMVKKIQAIEQKYRDEKRLGENERLIDTIGFQAHLSTDVDLDEIDRIFNKLPKEYKDNFKDEIYVKVKTRELKDLEIIDALSKILDIDLRNI